MSGPTEWGNSWVTFGFPPVGLANDERMDVAQNLDGHLEVFAVGSDGAVWHRWQTAPNGIWSEWASFGQPNGVSFSRPAFTIQVAQNDDGRLEVFLVGSDNNVWHIWQVVPNANWIDHWTSLGRPNVPVGFISLVRNQGREVEIFVKNDETGELWSIRQIAPNGGWVDNWTSLGFPLGQRFTPAIIDFSAVLNANNQLEVLAIAPDGAIWHNVRRFNPTRLEWVWSGWSVAVGAPSGVNLLGIKALRQNQDGRLELVCSADNRDYWHTWQVSPPSPDHWSGFWDNFGQPPGGMPGGVFAMRLDANGLLEGLTMGSDFATYLISQSAPNNGWTGWRGLIRINFELQPNVVMSQNQDGRLEAFTRSRDAIWHIAQHR